MIERLSLRAALRAYAPVDERESGFVSRMLALLDDDQLGAGSLALDGAGEPVAATSAPEEDVFSRARFVPGHFTASAFVLSPDGDELFLIRHPKLGLWLQPGGHVESDDRDVLAGARREVREEVGLADAALHPSCTGVFDVDIHPIPARRDEPEHEHFDVRYLFRAPSKDAVRATAEVKGGRWVRVADIEAAGTDESVARAARKAAQLVHRG